MWIATDVHYESGRSVVGAVGFLRWTDTQGMEWTRVYPGAAAAYEPGQFYKRELPLLLATLNDLPPASGVIVDGYVWLGPDRKGLGAYLHEAIDLPVIGVAKRPFHGADGVAEPVLRGTSANPLWVTAAGMRVSEAVDAIRRMHGAHRLPTLLKRVDRLCRGD